MFHLEYITDIDQLQPDFHVVRRVAVKGIAVKNGKLLLISTNQGDYKFPGGGVKSGETIEQTLRREMKEETGHEVTWIGEMLGDVIERHLDLFSENTIFEMISLYIACEVSDEAVSKQTLDDYEAQQQFTPVFVELKNAVKNNETLLESLLARNSKWLQRETDVMEKLIEMSI